MPCDQVEPDHKVCHFRHWCFLGQILKYSGKRWNWQSEQFWIVCGHPELATGLRSLVLDFLVLGTLSKYPLVRFLSKQSSAPMPKTMFNVTGTELKKKISEDGTKPLTLHLKHHGWQAAHPLLQWQLGEHHANCKILLIYNSIGLPRYYIKFSQSQLKFNLGLLHIPFGNISEFGPHGSAVWEIPGQLKHNTSKRKLWFFLHGLCITSISVNVHHP